MGYFYYCYKLGIFPKGRPQNRARLHFLLREDLLKLNNISQEVRLLARHQIDTAEQLALYKKRDEQNRRKELPINKANGNQKSLGASQGRKNHSAVNPAPEKGMEKADQAERRSCLAER